MATTVLNQPILTPWVSLSIPANTQTEIQLANSGAYLLAFVGNATQSQIATILVGNTGNVSHTIYGDNTALTITDGSGNGRITLQCSTARNVYITSLNNTAPAKLVS